MRYGYQNIREGNPERWSWGLSRDPKISLLYSRYSVSLVHIVNGPLLLLEKYLFVFNKYRSVKRSEVLNRVLK